MTMSHLLKQTKKCCVKIIRKLSLNSSTTGGGGGASSGGGGDDDQSPTAGGVGLNNRITAKYVLHKNCTPTRCKIQPGCPEGGTGNNNNTTNTSFDELRHSTFGWSASSGLEHHHHHPSHDGGFHPLAEEQSIAGESLSFRRSYSGSDDNIPETQNNYSAARNAKNLPKKRTNITSNKNVNLRKCFRLRSKTFDTTPSIGTAGPPVVMAAAAGVTQEVTAPVQPSGAGAPAADAEAPDSQTLANNNSSSRLIGARLDKISKSLMRGVEVGGGPEEHHHHHGGGLAKISKPLFLTSKKHRRSNYNHIDAADDDEDDECEEVVTVEELGSEMTTEGGEGRWRRSYHQAQAQEAITLTSSALMFSAGDRQQQQQPQFRAQQEQETTLTTPAVANQYHHHQNGPSVLERLTVAETAAAILFEKVKYDRTKRYLIDQLTEAESTSLSGGPGSPASLAFQGLSSSCSSSPFHLAVAAAAAKSEDFVDPWRNYNIRGGASWDKVSKSPWDSSASVKASPVTHSTPPPPAPPTSQQPVSAPAVQSSYTPIRSHWNPFEYSPAHLARLATTGSSQQQQHVPSSAGVVEPKHPQYRPAFQVQTDVWENLNNKHYEIDTDVVWRSTRCSSRRTSASTVETWIDDETFDNSFNEELERRCATLQICE